MTNQLFEAALGIKSPWFVQAVAFDASQRRLTVGIDFVPGNRFAHPNTPGEHPVYDTQIKQLRHLNFSSMSAISKCACRGFDCQMGKWRWPRLGRGRLQRAGRRRHRAPSDRDARGHECRQRHLATRLHGKSKAVLETDKLEVVADRGYFNGEEILACQQADITVTLPKPLRSGAKSKGRFGKQDFVYLPEEDVDRCPAGETSEILLHCRGERAADAPLLDERVPDLPDQGAVHDRRATSHHAMGA